MTVRSERQAEMEQDERVEDQFDRAMEESEKTYANRCKDCSAILIEEKEIKNDRCYFCQQLNDNGYKIIEDRLVNKHGVVGCLTGNSPEVFVPEVCYSCSYFDGDCWNDGHEITSWCMKNILFPTKKGTCKKQRKERQM